MRSPEDPLAPFTRLRDQPGGSSLAARAGGLIRAVAPPPPLGARADARVLAAVQASPPGFRLPRLLAPVAALLLIAVSGVSAVAALEWWRLPRATPVAVSDGPANLPSPAAPGRRAVAESPRPVVHLAAVPRPPEPTFARAQLAIDPRDPGHRPQVPAEFWRAHVSERFAWKVKVCVNAGGQVRGVTLLDHRHPALDTEVARAISRWRYHPATRAGKPVPSCWNLVYHLTVEPPGQP